MSNKTKNIINVICLVLFIGMLWRGYTLTENKKSEFEALNKKVESYQTTTTDRIAKSIISLPDDNNITVGMNDNTGTYKIPLLKREGILKIDSESLKTTFVKGEYEKKNPRLDAIVPMTVSSDSLDGSTYIILFNDRGDVALEKSYARIGNLSVKVNNIEIVTKDTSAVNQEYKVNIKYTMDGKEKETTIPVVDGHFDPSGTVSN